MLTRVDQSPDGVTVVVPQALATAVGLFAGGQAEVELVGGQLDRASGQHPGWRARVTCRDARSDHA